MSRAPHGVQIRSAARLGDGELVDLLVRDGLWCALSDQGMGLIFDRANTHLAITRSDQDEFAVESHRRAAQATASGRLKKEIVPIIDVLIDDEGIRADSTPGSAGRPAPCVHRGREHHGRQCVSDVRCRGGGRADEHGQSPRLRAASDSRDR